MIPTILRRRLTLGGLAIAALVAIGASTSQAADPFVAGGRSTRHVDLSTGGAEAARARGHAVLTALGVAGARETVERLDDRFDHRTYDEVTSLDARGRPVAITRLDLDGSVGMAVALGWHRIGDLAVDGPGAVAQAHAAAQAAGLAPHGRPDVRASAGAGGWVVSWPRFVGDVAVRGDGVRILLFADGAFHGLTRTERPLATVPARILDRDAARSFAERAVAARAGSRAGDLRVAAVELAWLASNTRADGTTLDAPDETLRLAWVVRLEASGALADSLRAVEVWLDAGDGHTLGGDVIE